jgi:hypothetical protein
MSPGILTRIAQVAAIAAALPMLLLAFFTNCDAGLAGAPEEETCAECHNGPSGSGSVTVTFPGARTYTPGARQHLVVNIADSAQKRWGFQLTARQANSSGTQAGTFTPGADGYTQLVCTQTDFKSQVFGNLHHQRHGAAIYRAHARRLAAGHGRRRDLRIRLDAAGYRRWQPGSIRRRPGRQRR